MIATEPNATALLSRKSKETTGTNTPYAKGFTRVTTKWATVGLIQPLSECTLARSEARTEA